MERTEEALRERVRETPLSERLKTCEKYVANMCAERRPPKMTIPLQHYDEDFYICTTLADAQATIAALQAELERTKSEMASELELQVNTVVREREQLKSHLTQRTAELEAAKAQHKDLVLRNRILRDRPDLPVERTSFHDEVVKLQAELERVRGERDEQAGYAQSYCDKADLWGELVDQAQKERDELRTLIAALPKVEGEIEVSSGVYNFILLKHDSGTRFLCGQIETEQTAQAIAALWEHRQGMEG